MDIDPVDKHISPYSSRKYQNIIWQEVTPGWLGIYRSVEWADPPVIEYLKDLKFATRSQLLKNFIRQERQEAH